MIALFAIGSLWFWLLIVVASALIIFAIEEQESASWATVAMIGTFLLMFFFSGEKETYYNFFRYVLEHPITDIVVILSYLLAGVVWSFVKWYFHLLKCKGEFERRGRRPSDNQYYDIPNAKDEKSKIISWMTYWPFSLTWTVINDPVRKAFSFIHDRIQGSYQKMSDNMFKDFKKKEK